MGRPKLNRTKVCPRCGVEFTPKDWRSTFCGYRCAALDRERKTRGGPIPTKTCERCGQEFPKNPDWNLSHWEERRFCSTACRGNGLEKTMLTCGTCGIEFPKSQYWHPSKQYYCSRECYWISLRTERYPVMRPHRKERNFSHRQRRLALERAGHACENCGATECLEVDHVIPVWSDGTNAITNAQVLCRPCHRTKTADDVAGYWESLAIS